MKKILAFLLALTLLPLAGCAKPEQVQEDPLGGEDQIDLSVYSAEALYDFAYTKTRARKRARFQTTLTFSGEEPFETVETVRIREGYDGFSLSRVGTEKLYYADETLSAETALGAFSATATTRQAEEYISEFWFPVTAPAPEEVTDLTREGQILSFTLSSEKAVSLFGGAVPAQKGVFLPQTATGQAEVTEEGLFGVTAFWIKGTLNGEEAVLELTTVLEQIQSEDISLATPSADGFQALGDIRIPHLLQNAIAALGDQAPVQTTLLSAEKVVTAEKEFSVYSEVNCYQTAEKDAYLSRQSLTSLPETEKQSTFYQFLLQGGVKTENEYDIIKGELLSESTGEGTFSFSDLLKSYLPSLSDLSEILLTEEQKQISITFSVNESGLKRIAAKLSDLFPESTLDANSVTGTGSGVFTLDPETGLLIASSFVLEGQNTASALSCSYSVTVDSTEEAPLPEMQIPSATTPGEGGTEHHDDH